MKVTPTAIPDVLIIEPKVFGDARGFFYESFNQKAFNEATGTNHQFVQDNHSRSAKGVLRGLLQVAAALPCFQPAFNGLQLGKRACQVTIGPCHFHHTSYLVLFCLL